MGYLRAYSVILQSMQAAGTYSNQVVLTENRLVRFSSATGSSIARVTQILHRHLQPLHRKEPFKLCDVPSTELQSIAHSYRSKPHSQSKDPSGHSSDSPLAHSSPSY